MTTPASVHRVTAGSGETVVLVHGLGGDVDFWEDEMSALAAEFHAVAIDLRGSGITPASADGHTIDDLADDVLAVLDDEGIEKAHVIGFSMGGLVAQSFAVRYPTRLRRLVLASTYAVMGPQARLFLDAIAVLVRGGATDRLVFELVGPWLFSTAYLSDPGNCLALRFPEGVEVEAGRPWLNQYVAQREFDGRGQLARIEAPTLVLGGTDDSLVPQLDMEHLAAQIPNARLSLFAGAGHLLNAEAPTRFLAEVTGFLTGR